MTLSLPWINHLFFIAIRLSAVLLFTPIQAIRQLPIHIRLLLVFIFSILFIGNTPNTALNNNHLLISGLVEFANGLILATSLYAAFAVFQIAGQIIDTQMGLNSLLLFKPDEHGQESVTGHLLSMLALLFFFSIDGHLWLFKGLCFSFTIIPPGTLSLFAGISPVLKQFSFMFSLSLMIASPIIIALVTLECASAILTRNIPQMNSYFFVLPLKIILGFIILILMLEYMNPLAQLAFESCFSTWQELMS